VSTRRSRRVAVLAGVLLLAVVGAACSGDDGGTTYVEPKGPPVAELDFEAENFSFSPKDLSAPPGILDITVTSIEGAHDFAIEGQPGFLLEVSATGKTATGKIKLKPDTYTFYCLLPGHRAAGMEGTLTVEKA